MSISFNCEKCGKKIVAPDEAGGRRGRCPYCQASNYIPSPIKDDEIYDLAPEDADEEARRPGLLQTGDADLALLAVFADMPVLGDEFHVVERRGLAHRTGLGLDPRERGDEHHALGLAEAFADLLAGELLPALGDLRIERLAGGGEVLHRGEVIRRDVFLKHEPVHRGRCAERGETIVLDLT